MCKSFLSGQTWVFTPNSNNYSNVPNKDEITLSIVMVRLCIYSFITYNQEDNNDQNIQTF